MEDDGFVGKRAPPEAICGPWDLFFRGTSLSGISRHLRTCWSVEATGRAVLNRVRGSSKLPADSVEGVLADLGVDGGTRWHEDLAVVKKQDELRYVWLLKGRGLRRTGARRSRR